MILLSCSVSEREGEGEGEGEGGRKREREREREMILLSCSVSERERETEREGERARERERESVCVSAPPRSSTTSSLNSRHPFLMARAAGQVALPFLSATAFVGIRFDGSDKGLALAYTIAY